MITLAQVHHAADCLRSVVIRTPIIASDELDHSLGVKVACKAENFQRTNAFKFRGAYYHVVGLHPKSRQRGVVGASSGNHAQALALSAQILGMKAAVLVPSDLPTFKLDAIRRYSAEVFFYNRLEDDRDYMVAEIADRCGFAVVPSSDSASVICGNGTVALEIMEDMPDFGPLLVPVGGGGLAAGCATVVKAISPKTKVIGVEPDTGNDTNLSLRKGARVVIPAPKTIADGLRHCTPAPVAFEINQRLLDDVLTVGDDAICAAMALAWRHLRVVLEPSGACALAALLAHKIPCHSGQVAVILSGGNIEEALFQSLIGTRTS
ncbi:MAG: L-threonine dehydratase catabolic TdcB [Syntrophorhabdus sp. PtaU1.Bin002]|nr:MAG: L-threonine dehydratase catabolic TdcB [Syntrophorhabdus sp. PtaU1.Bin002]